jgi:hypothetical protein
MASRCRKIVRFAAKAMGLEKSSWARRTWIERLLKAQVIEFYVPKRFRKSPKRIGVDKSGKLVAFPSLTKKSA